MQTISVQALHHLLENPQERENTLIVDVRTPVERKEIHIDGVKHVPLEDIMKHVDDFRDKRVILHCRSGNRSASACRQLEEQGITTVNVEGGITAWEAAGLPVRRGRVGLPIMRQVMFAAGLMTLTGVILGFAVHEYWFLLAGFVGAGLTVSGATGWCGMLYLLQMMPWNKA